MNRAEYKKVAEALAASDTPLALIAQFADVLGPLNERFDRDQFVADSLAGNTAPRRRFGDRRQPGDPVPRPASFGAADRRRETHAAAIQPDLFDELMDKLDWLAETSPPLTEELRKRLAGLKTPPPPHIVMVALIKLLRRLPDFGDIELAVDVVETLTADRTRQGRAER